MTRRLRRILGDQLTRELSALRDLDSGCDVVLMPRCGPKGSMARITVRRSR